MHWYTAISPLEYGPDVIIVPPEMDVGVEQAAMMVEYLMDLQPEMHEILPLV